MCSAIKHNNTFLFCIKKYNTNIRQVNIINYLIAFIWLWHILNWNGKLQEYFKKEQIA